MFEEIKKKKKEYKNDKNLIDMLEDLEMFYNFHDKFNYRLKEIYQNKTLGSVAKMLYSFLVFNGGVFHYESKTELYDKVGMTHPLVNKAIYELQEKGFIKHSKANKILIII